MNEPSIPAAGGGGRFEFAPELVFPPEHLDQHFQQQRAQPDFVTEGFAVEFMDHCFKTSAQHGRKPLYYRQRHQWSHHAHRACNGRWKWRTRQHRC